MSFDLRDSPTLCIECGDVCEADWFNPETSLCLDCEDKTTPAGTQHK